MPARNKENFQQAIDALRSAQTYENAQAAANLLGTQIETDIDDLPLFRGTVYPERQELVDELLRELEETLKSFGDPDARLESSVYRWQEQQADQDYWKQRQSEGWQPWHDHPTTCNCPSCS